MLMPWWTKCILQTLFTILMDNALKYRKETLILTVSTWNDKDKLFISIEDNGIGIKRENMKHFRSILRTNR